MVASAPLIGVTKADGRKLSRHDLFYFDNCFAPLNAVFSMSATGLPKSDKKFQQAFDRVIATSPLLQTRVEGPDVFRKVHPSKWPKLAIAPKRVEHDSELMKEAREVLNRRIRDMTNGGQDAQRMPVHTMMLMRSPRRIALMIITPHHFVDGTGLGIICIKLCQYARMPKALWPALDTLSMDAVPTFWEMSLKQNLPKLDGLLEGADVKTSEKMSEDNFRFECYDMSDPSKLTCVLNDRVGFVHKKNLRTCQNALKSYSGGKLSLTSAFGGLAIKTLAHLLEIADKNGIQIPNNRSHLLCTTPIDGRFLDKWGDRRDQNRKFPVVGNYAFSGGTQIPFEEAKEQSVEEIGLMVKNSTVTRLRKDVDYRILTIKASYSEMLPSSGMYVGCSSVILPRGSSISMGLKDVEIDARIDFGSVPHVWFYLVTCGNQTQVDADISLPLPGFGRKDAEMAIYNSVDGSSLECLFNVGK